MRTAHRAALADSLRALDDTEPVEVSEGAIEVHAVAHDPAVSDFESDVVGLDGRTTAGRLAHEHGDAHGARCAAAHERADGLEGAALVGDVVGDDHVAIAEAAGIAVLEHDLAQLRTVTPARAHLDLLRREAARLQSAREARGEAPCTLGDHDEQRRAPAERARELGSQRVDSLAHSARRVQLEHAAPRHVLERHDGDPIARPAPRAKRRRVEYGGAVPVVPAPAATVILLRDSAAGPEVLMLERHARSEFLPDAYVFPGGRVEDEDHELAERVAGLSRAVASARLATVPAGQALGFFVAGVRETYEESGILLARRRGSPDLLDASRAAALARHRLEVQKGDASFRDLVLGEDLVLAAELLSVHAHWITPEDSPRRFDTIFFAAETPPGQKALHDGVELTDHVWLRPEQGVADFRAGRRHMILPTWANLETLSGFPTAAATLEASRQRPIVPILPVLVEHDGRRRVVIPPNAGYPTTEELVGTERA